MTTYEDNRVLNNWISLSNEFKDHDISKEEYDMLLNIKWSPNEEQINIDIERSGLGSGVESESLKKCLLNILNAYSKYDPTNGYFQGLNLIAAFIIKNTSLCSENEVVIFNLIRRILEECKYNLRDYQFALLESQEDIVESFIKSSHLPKQNEENKDYYKYAWSILFWKIIGTLWTNGNIYDNKTTVELWNLFLKFGWCAVYAYNNIILSKGVEFFYKNNIEALKFNIFDMIKLLNSKYKTCHSQC
jgi:hypothetical protein